MGETCMSGDEFSYLVQTNAISGLPAQLLLEPTPAQAAHLATRFGLGSLEHLRATVAVLHDPRGVRVTGQVEAAFHYLCRVSAEPFPAKLVEPFDVLFLEGVTEAELPSPEDAALAADPLELLPLEGHEIDIAQLAADTLALALDPFPRGPVADTAMKQLGILTEEEARRASSPFAILANPAQKS
jgi:uncharacterized metal-binding protein YceD (DUF177 family)